MATQISPSILAAPLAHLAAAAKQIEAAGCEYIHIDVMDGHFVPALTFGDQITAAIQAESSVALDVHLMVARPEVEAPKYYALKPKIITFHYEATTAPIRLAEQIRAQGIRAGIALNPCTPVSALKDIIHAFDLVLFMSIEPGFYGQKFIESSWERLAELKALKEREHAAGRRLEIEVDGGVSDVNCRRLTEGGVDILVSGSYLFKGDMKERVQKLRA
ncbi:ribulose-phosphate 3-epimerase [Turneriella parva]|uniref:Ribulose-phosphate 3-epimerase n=1 Tax=Turneriella parva (strain ATCC BAA-1111 / DSM 21527 / NCTC 11395 / H) TaxID=869212 RepID=I4B8E6_TURPD|nr:ribulose-phosphate 3-epimerase [Turneriella parva]AFM13553.1 ribulose-5-phosphate 3-epimerase [Turneriella parva DSM 21527]